MNQPAYCRQSKQERVAEILTGFLLIRIGKEIEAARKLQGDCPECGAPAGRHSPCND